MAEALLEDRLRALGDAMAFPSESTLADDVMAELAELDGGPARSRWRRPLLVAAAVLLVATTVVLAVPGSRRSIARWLGFDELRIERVDEVPPTFAVTAPGLTLEEAAERVGVTPLVATDLGPIRSVEAPLDRYVVVRYDEALVATLPGRVDDALFRKIGTGELQIQPVDLFGETAYWVTGESHLFLYEAPGGAIEEARPADDTLVWQRGDVIVRVEGNVTLERAIEIARSVVEP